MFRSDYRSNIQVGGGAIVVSEPTPLLLYRIPALHTNMLMVLRRLFSCRRPALIDEVSQR